MKCSVLIAFSFVFCASAYGSTSAIVAQALAQFTPELIIVFRMLFGCGFCTIVFIFRLIFQKGYVSVIKSQFKAGFWPTFHLCIAGLLNLGIPHSLTAIAQLWIPSAAVQLMKSLTPTVSQVCSHFLFVDEKFTWFTFTALICAVVGVSLNAIPSFLHSNAQTSIKNMGFGYGLLVAAVVFLGISPVYLKWKTPNTDVTFSSMVQTGAAFILDICWSLIMDGPKKIGSCLTNATWNGWIWPLILGVAASGIGVHCFMYLVNNLGAVGANFIQFGQIIIGVGLGVAWLKEWRKYNLWEILMSVAGLMFLTAAIVIGFWHPKQPIEEKDEEEDELPAENIANEDDGDDVDDENALLEEV